MYLKIAMSFTPCLTSLEGTPTITRNSTTSFNKDLCLLCQIDVPKEKLFEVCQDSRDKVLKDAFAECPNSLQI